MFERKVEKNQGEWFEGIEAAREYAESAKKSTMKYRTFLEALKSLEIKGKYLDIGAGPGVLTTMIAQGHPEVEITALEVSPNMASLGRDHVKENGLQEYHPEVLEHIEMEHIQSSYATRAALVPGQTDLDRPGPETPIKGLYIVGTDTAGAGVGLQQAANSAEGVIRALEGRI